MIYSKEKLKLSKSERRKMDNIYGGLYDDLESSDAQYARALKKFPIIDTMVVFAFDPDASEAELSKAEAIITNNALAEDKIDLATWQKVMKWIIGAALGILLGYVAVLVVANVSFYAMALVLSIFGSGVVSAFVSLVVFCYFVWRSSEMLFGVWSDIMHAYTDFYNEHIAGITAKVTSWVNAVKEWIVRLADKAKSVLAGSSNETGTRQADNNEEQGAHQGELAMA